MTGVEEIPEASEAINTLLGDADIRKMWIKMHTPFLNKIKLTGRKIGRNEICPFCTSGKKFKNCECYKSYIADRYFKGEETYEIKGKIRNVQ